MQRGTSTQKVVTYNIHVVYFTHCDMLSVDINLERGNKHYTKQQEEKKKKKRTYRLYIFGSLDPHGCTIAKLSLYFAKNLDVKPAATKTKKALLWCGITCTFGNKIKKRLN